MAAAASGSDTKALSYMESATSSTGGHAISSSDAKSKGNDVLLDIRAFDKSWVVLTKDLKSLRPGVRPNGRLVDWGIARELLGRSSWMGTNQASRSRIATLFSSKWARSLMDNPDHVDRCSTGGRAGNPFLYDLVYMPYRDKERYWTLAVLMYPWRLIPSVRSERSRQGNAYGQQSGSSVFASNAVYCSSTGSSTGQKWQPSYDPSMLRDGDRRIDLVALACANTSGYARREASEGPSHDLPMILWLDSMSQQGHIEVHDAIGAWLQRAALRIYPDEMREKYGLRWVDEDDLMRDAISQRLPMPHRVDVKVPKQPSKSDSGVYVVHFAACLLRNRDRVWNLIEVSRSMSHLHSRWRTRL
ncbi:hypothetical protein OC846_005912 [Tilletia horrida]|uniref:Ubiquitin-like protease family profile domain-containing protein n=1 Tax=Tilletia horrida TaxID=155126 RepID=A0AAN6GKV9_9BASI|nr:hypothetical protein OC846_005912 [Tilletia horrida]